MTTGARARIRIVQIMEATIGGTGKHLLQLARRLDRRHFELTIVCATERYPGFWDELAGLRDVDLAVIELPMIRSIRPLNDLQALWRLWRLLRRERFDIVHTHSSKAGLVGRLAARLAYGAGMHVVHTPHVFAFHFTGEFSGASRRLFLAVERLLGRWTSILIAVSSAESRAAVRSRIVPEEKVRYVPNGVEIDHRRPAVHAIRASLGLRENDRVLATVGLLEAAKGQEHLIAALPRVLTEFPHVKCLVVGDGRLRTRLEEQATAAGLASVVVFTGHRDDAWDVMGCAEMLVLPSLWEGLPYVILEAMAIGMPVVSSDVGGCRDVVLDGETGRLVPPRDLRALAEAICQLLRDPVLATRMGERGRERVRASFDVNSMIARHEAIYNELVACRQAAPADGANRSPRPAGTAPGPC